MILIQANEDAHKIHYLYFKFTISLRITMRIRSWPTDGLHRKMKMLKILFVRS